MRAIADHLLPSRACLAEQRRKLTAAIADLEAQHRQDEADLHKIRLNIVEVFETVAAADEPQCAAWEDFCARYLPRFETLTAPWRARLSAAALHGDAKTVLVEETKLSTAQAIRSAFVSLGEE